MDDPELAALLATVVDDNLDAVLVLSDFLEERGDPRAAELRAIYESLYDHWLFAPFSFRHFHLVREAILPLFPATVLPSPPYSGERRGRRGRG